MTTSDRVQRLLRHAWTITRDDLQDGEIALRVAELPHFVVAGTEDQVTAEFWGALEGYLTVAVARGVPLPDAPVSERRKPIVACVDVPPQESVTADSARPEPARHAWAEPAYA